MSDPGRYIHGTVIVAGERGILIRGDSGSGKSRLAMLLVAEARRRGWFAALVGDDRVELTARGTRVLARGHPAIAGLVERRGEGLTAMPFEAACALDCVIDLSPAGAARFPEPDGVSVELLGIRLLRIEEVAGLRFVDPARLLDRISGGPPPQA